MFNDTKQSNKARHGVSNLAGTLLTPAVPSAAKRVQAEKWRQTHEWSYLRAGKRHEDTKTLRH